MVSIGWYLGSLKGKLGGAGIDLQSQFGLSVFFEALDSAGDCMRQ